MAIGPDGYRYSKLEGCVSYADVYLLSAHEAREIVDHQIEVIEANWHAMVELAELTTVEQDYFWRRQFLNPYALEDYRASTRR